MIWTPTMRRGAFWTGLGTVLFTALTLVYLWQRSRGMDGVTPVAFLKMAAIIVAIWSAIGITMGIFIVMILRKNEGRK